ncbi:TPA: YPDG domain-containing protein, partial [Streptococcus suis]|nr:YPDG domain-containing protein [Streptococcus suis]
MSYSRRTKKFDWYKAKQRFSIRTYHFGAASVLLGMSLVTGAQSVSAVETVSDISSSNEVVTEVTAGETVSQGTQSAVAIEEVDDASSVPTEEVIKDLVAPPAPVIQTDLTGKAGQAVAVIVSAEAGSNVALYDAAGQLLGSGTADDSGQAIIIITLGQTETSLTALATDQAGNVSEASEVVQVTVAARAETSTVVAPSVETVVATPLAPTAVEETRKVLEQVASEAAVLASEGERLVATTETTNTVLQKAVEDARMVASQSEQVLADSLATLEQLTAQIDAVRSRVEVLAVELRKFSPDGLITAKLDASAPEKPTNVMADSKGIKSVTSQYIGKDSEGLDMVKWTITHDSKPGRHWQFILIATSDKFNNSSASSDIRVTNGNTFEGKSALRIYDWQGSLGYMNLSPLGSYFGTENGSGFYTNEKPGPGAGANRAILWDNSWRNESQSDYVIEVITHGPNHTLYVRSASSTSQVRTETLLRYPSETGNTDWDDTLAALPENQRTGANKIVNNDGFLKAPIVKYPSVVANDGGSVTVTPSREAGDDANRVEFTYKDESNVNRTVTITKDSNGRWSVPSSSGLTADPVTGAVTIPADSVLDGSVVSATAKDIANNQAGPVTAIAKNDPAPANTPSTATDKQILYLFNNTAIATVANGTANPDNVNKVKIATLADREGIKSVAVGGGSLGYTVDTAGYATGTPSVTSLGKFSRTLNVTDNQNQVSNVLTDGFMTYVMDASSAGTITKAVGQSVTEQEILNNVTINPGNEGTVINDTTDPKFRKVLAPGQQVPTTAGTHTVTVRVITDSNVYKDVPVTVVMPENPPATATDKQNIYVFNNTEIATVGAGTNTADNVNKVKIATLNDPQGIQSVAVGGGSLGYTVDNEGNATGTPSVTALGHYSRSLDITDRTNQVTTVFSNGTDRYNTYIMDASSAGRITKAVGQSVTEQEILNNVTIDPGNAGAVINDAADPKFRKVLAPGQTVPTTAGTHTVTVRVITDSNVYKDVPVTVVIPENPPATATDKQNIYVFNNTEIATVGAGTDTADNVNKVKIATIADPQGIQSVAVGGGSLGYTVDNEGNATGTPSVTALGHYSRSLDITDRTNQVTTVFSNGTDRYNTYIMDASSAGTITKTVGQTVTAQEILDNVTIDPGNAGAVINDAADPKFRKVLAPGQTVPTTAGTHTVTVRVITDSNVYKDVPVTVVIPEKPITDNATPIYAEKTVVPGTPATSTPTFTDANGQPITAPAGTRYEIPADFQAPEGYQVEINPQTGEVTVTAAKGTTVESIEVPVKVTYTDGSPDTAPAVFKLDTDGDG